MIKKVAKVKKKEGLKHCQEIIAKVDVEIDFRNRVIKMFKNGKLNLFEELKGMVEVLHP